MISSRTVRQFCKFGAPVREKPPRRPSPPLGRLWVNNGPGRFAERLPPYLQTRTLTPHNVSRNNVPPNKTRRGNAGLGSLTRWRHLSILSDVICWPYHQGRKRFRTMKGTRLLSRRQLNGYCAALSLSLPAVGTMTEIDRPCDCRSARSRIPGFQGLAQSCRGKRH